MYATFFFLQEGGLGYHGTQPPPPPAVPRPFVDNSNYSYWHMDSKTAQRERTLPPTTIPQPVNTFWDGPDPRFQGQRRGSDNRKNFVGSEER